MDRHDRQARLGDVGPAGQARIAAATVTVTGDGFAAEVATRYLAGAGVGRLRVRDGALARVAVAIDPAVRVEIAAVDAGSPSDGSDFRDAVAREAARGARDALRALRRVLEGAS
jgi:hypothetical protein